MYKCPKCHNPIAGNIKTCPECNFKLKITLEEYKANELRVHGHYKNRSPKNNKLVQRFFNEEMDKFNVFINSNSYKGLLKEYSVNEDELNLIIYDTIADLFLDNHYRSRSKFKFNVKDKLLNYNGEYQNNHTSLLNNLKYLFDLIGFYDPSEYYKQLLNENRINQNTSLKIEGLLIKDILNNVETEKIKSKLMYHIKRQSDKQNKILKNNLNKYYRLTGKYYFSKRFDQIIEVHNLSVNDAFHVKSMVLKKIYEADDYIDVKELFEFKLKNKIRKETSKPHDKRRLGSKTGKYNRNKSNEYNVLGDY